MSDIISRVSISKIKKSFAEEDYGENTFLAVEVKLPNGIKKTKKMKLSDLARSSDITEVIEAIQSTIQSLSYDVLDLKNTKTNNDVITGVVVNDTTTTDITEGEIILHPVGNEKVLFVAGSDIAANTPWNDEDWQRISINDYIMFLRQAIVNLENDKLEDPTDVATDISSVNLVAKEKTNGYVVKVDGNDVAKASAGTDQIKNITQTATEADLKAGNYLALDGADGTKRLPAEAVAKSGKVSVIDVALSSESENLFSQFSVLSQCRIPATTNTIATLSTYRIYYHQVTKGDIYKIHAYAGSNRIISVGFFENIPAVGETTYGNPVRSTESDYDSYKDWMVEAPIDGYIAVSVGALGAGDNKYIKLTPFGRLDAIEDELEDSFEVALSHGGLNSSTGAFADRHDRLVYDEFLRLGGVLNFDKNSVDVDGTNRVLQYVTYCYDKDFNFLGVEGSYHTIPLAYKIASTTEGCEFVKFVFRLGSSSSTYVNDITDEMVSALGSISLDESLKNSVDDVRRKIAELEPNSEDTLPAGYADFLADKISKIDDIELSVGSQHDSFLFFTDQHWFAKNGSKLNYLLSPKIAEILMTACTAKKLFSGGDYVYSEATEVSARKSALYVRKNVVPLITPVGSVYQAQGNHDVLYEVGGAQKYPQSVVADIMRDGSTHAVYNHDDMDGSYFFVDNEREKIRYIVFQTTSTTTGNNLNTYYKQTKWICEKAILSLGEGWRIIAFSHIPSGSVIIDGARYSSTNSSIIDILSAVNSKSSVTIDGQTFDFSQLDDVAVTAYFCGHHHADLQTFYRGVWCIASASDCPLSDNAARSMYFSHAIPRGKTLRDAWVAVEDHDFTTNEQVIDYCVADVSNDLLSCIRVGAYYDRKFHLAPINIAAGSSETLTTSLSGDVTWHIYDNEHAAPSTYIVEADGSVSSVWTGLDSSPYATISNGIVTGVAAGTCIVMAMDADGNKEHWAIIVQ